MSLLDSYNQWLDESPLISRMVSSAVAYGLGDIIAQVLEAQLRNVPISDNLKPVRATRMLLFGGFVYAPVAVTWYSLLNALITGQQAAAVLFKVFLDQTLFGAFITVVLFTVTTLMEGKSIDVARTKIQTSAFPTLVTSWYVWPWVQLFNMGIVPEQYQILVINCVSIPWSAYLAMQAAKPAAPSDKIQKGDHTETENLL